ncbi:MAG: hypothetical protein R3D44_17400 [Hyphomicrobiaceae bacterium]
MRFASILACAVVAGCSVHPLPSDVTLDTFSIVKRVECEAHRAVLATAVSRMLASANPRVRDLGLDLQRGRRKLDEKLFKEFERRAENGREILARWQNVTMGFGFAFKITENNNNGGGATLNVPVGMATLTVGLSAAENKSREAQREFELVLNLGELLVSTACEKHPVHPGRAFSYPISGDIGLAETFRTFTDLWLDAGDRLQVGSRKFGTKLDGFVDVLSFTTTISGGIAPEVTLAASKNSARITKASLAHGSSRTDEHKLYILIVPKKPEEQPRTAKAVAPSILFRPSPTDDIVERLRQLKTQDALRNLPLR